ncbi:MAG TPA: phosphotransferase [Kofleriaceae bacterium]|nr:phosphotransferase [Kofleriaceae bacterium]
MTDARAQPITVVFPIAGRAPHAGFKYKPFLEIGSETAIQAAVAPFRPYVAAGAVKKLVFVCLREQDAQFGVTARLWSMFHDLPIEIVTLERPTRGPAETLLQAVDAARITGPVIVCDSDHALGVEPIFERIARGDVDCVLPVWSLRGEDLRAWAVAAIASGGRVTGIAEKRLPDCAGDFLGVIGCVYLADIHQVARAVEPSDTYVSNLVARLIASGARVEAVPLSKMEMFGDSKKLRQARARRDAATGTIFCDIDGVITTHEDVPSYAAGLAVLPGAIEKLQAWMDQGYMIILTTARVASDEEAMRRALALARVPYHRLLMGLPSGPRFLINDRKPSALLTSQAQALEVERNQGIAHLHIQPAAPTILRRFKGGSFAETLLVEDDEKLFVRKRVTKRENLSLGYAKLKNQFRTMERFAKLSEGLVPALYGEHDNTIEYSYDMEYLPGHKLLAECPPAEQEAGLARLLATMGERVYGAASGTGAGAGEDWLVSHLGRKIWARLDAMRAHAALDALVSASEVVIDGRVHPGLSRLLNRAAGEGWIGKLAPGRVCTVHGDLTFENVLWADGDVRLIDMDGADYVDAPELDMGKLFQSAVARYEAWAHASHKLFESVRGHELVTASAHRPMLAANAGHEQALLTGWAPILGVGRDEARTKGLFYMGLHLVRMVPFRLKVSEEQALFALSRAIEAISTALEVSPQGN